MRKKGRKKEWKEGGEREGERRKAAAWLAGWHHVPTPLLSLFPISLALALTHSRQQKILPSIED